MDISKIRGVTDQILGFLSNIGVVDEADVIEALEAYKFVDRSDIIAAFNNTDSVYKVVSKETVDNSKYLELGKKYGVFIEEGEHDVVNVYAKMLTTVPLTAIELEVGLNEVIPYFVTPYNFNLLKDKEYKYQYNPEVLFKRILMQALKLHATDLHFDVKHVNMRPVYTISYRRDADLLTMELFDLDKDMNASIISKLIETKTGASSLDLLSADGVIASTSNILGTDDVELRISANKVKDGYHYVIRIQQKKTFTFTLDKLGFHVSVLDDLREISNKRNGITLITGAIRTGKNTTAFAVANEIKSKPVKIISYESPIEVLMPFSQVDYFDDENILLNAVRLAKKQDVNVAFLNEIPNKEVAFAVRDLANSSIHVITTLHMNRIWHLPYKLKEYYGDDYKDVISQINGVFNQKMYGVNCPFCSQNFLIDELKNDKHKMLAKKYGIASMAKSVGCEKCAGFGVQPGRNQPYVEHLLFTEEIIDKLLACDHPYQMERVIRDEVRSKHQTLEDYMMPEFEHGKIPLIALDDIC